MAPEWSFHVVWWRWMSSVNCDTNSTVSLPSSNHMERSFYSLFTVIKPHGTPILQFIYLYQTTWNVHSTVYLPSSNHMERPFYSFLPSKTTWNVHSTLYLPSSNHMERPFYSLFTFIKPHGTSILQFIYLHQTTWNVHSTVYLPLSNHMERSFYSLFTFIKPHGTFILWVSLHDASQFHSFSWCILVL
jgi:hypothetical protein